MYGARGGQVVASPRSPVLPNVKHLFLMLQTSTTAQSESGQRDSTSCGNWYEPRLLSSAGNPAEEKSSTSQTSLID